MRDSDLVIFALNASRRFAEAVSRHLGLPLAPHEEQEFEDGEHKIRPLVSVRGKDVFVIQSMYGDWQESVHDKLCRCLFFILERSRAGKIAIIIDDIISAGRTIVRAAEVCLQNGAVSVYAAASHGLFSGEANTILSSPALENIVVTNSVPAFRFDSDLVQQKLVVLDAAPLFAEAIKRIHSGQSIVEYWWRNARAEG
jgi:phosphoribosylpyrophosphate synthetase